MTHYRNGLAGAGDLRILEYASTHNFILVSTDSDFESLLSRIFGAKVVILRSCNYPAEVLRCNPIRVATYRSALPQPAPTPAIQVIDE